MSRLFSQSINSNIKKKWLLKIICKACRVYLKGVYILIVLLPLPSLASFFLSSSATKSTNRDARCISASRACTPEREADQKLVHFRSMSSNPFSTRSIRFRAHFLAASSPPFLVRLFLYCNNRSFRSIELT